MRGAGSPVYDCSGEPARSLQTPLACFIFTAGHTHNRIRAPRLAASGQYKNVGKGSRQNRSVTLGKGLDLRVAPGGLLSEFDAGGGTAVQTVVLLVVWGIWEDVLQLPPRKNTSHVRTGADKGNPTV
jgi:hypothetical protein